MTTFNLDDATATPTWASETSTGIFEVTQSDTLASGNNMLIRNGIILKISGSGSGYRLNLKGTITIELKKKTIQSVYNQVMMCSELGFPNFLKVT